MRHRNVRLVQAEWNRDYLEELAMFPNARHDDQVDATSGAFGYLARHSATFDVPTISKIERLSPARWGINIDLADAHKLR